MSKIKSNLKYLILPSLYLLLGIIFTWPLATNITTLIPNNITTQAKHTFQWGDHLQMVAGIKEHKNSIENLISNKPIYEKEFCFKPKEECKLSFISIFKKVVLSAYWQQTILLFLIPSNIELVYNLSILLSFVLTGIAGFLYAKEFLINSKLQKKYIYLLAFTASLFATLAPLRIHQMLVGHKNGFLMWILILIMYLFEKSLNRKSNNIWKSLLSGFLLIYLAANEQFLLLLAFGYIASRILWIEVYENKFSVFKSIKIFLNKVKEYFWIMVTFVLSIGINIIGKLDSINNSVISEGRSISEISLYSPKISDLFNNVNSEHELNLYLGFGVIVVIAGLILAIYKTFKEEKKKVYDTLFYLLLLTYLILFISLGTNTPVYEFLYNNIPVFKFGRTPIRYAFILFPLISVIYVLVMSEILKKLPKYKTIFIITTLTTLIITFTTFQPISLAKLPESINNKEFGEKIIFIPFTQPDNFFGSIFEYYISETQSVTLNGYTPFVNKSESNFFDEFKTKLNTGSLSGSDFEKLSTEYNVNTIVLLKNYFGLTNFDLPEEETKSNNIKEIETNIKQSGYNKIMEDNVSIIWKL